jgi:hypothetical protein
MSEFDTLRDALPADMKDATLVKESKSFEAIVKQALDLQSMIGNSIRIPGEGADDTVKADFNSKLERLGLVPKDKAGEYLRPKTDAEYTLTAPPEDAQALGLSQNSVDSWKKFAHEQGYSPAQFNAFANAQISALRESVKQSNERFAQSDQILKEKWGEASFETRKTMAFAAMQKYASPELVDRMGKSPDPEVLLAFAEIGKQFTEKGMGDLTIKPVYAETRGEAALKLAEIRANPQHAFNQGPMGASGRKAYEAAEKEVMRLQALSLGQKPPAGGDFMFDRAG